MLGRKAHGPGADLLPENPVRQIREKLGFSRSTFARALGVRIGAVQAVESGFVPVLPDAIAKSLSRNGYDARQIETDYAHWLAAVTATERTRMRERGGQSEAAG